MKKESTIYYIKNPFSSCGRTLVLPHISTFEVHLKLKHRRNSKKKSTPLIM